MRRLKLLAGVATGFSLLAALAGAQEASEAPNAGPAALWTTAGALDDTNGDGFADDANLRIQLHDTDDAVQRAAGANLALRMGLEAMSLDLPLALGRGPRVLIGTPSPTMSNLRGADASDHGYVSEDPATGDIYVWGGSDETLTRAATWLAGRAPRVWDDRTPELGEASQAVDDWAAESAVDLGRVWIAGVVVGDGAGLVDLVVATEMLTEAGIETLTDKIGPAVAGTSSITLLRPDGSAGLRVESSAEPLEEPTGGSSSGPEVFDLADFYTTRGIYGDANGDEIPDRLDATLSAADGLVDLYTLAARIGLEATGGRIPAVVAPSEATEFVGTPILIGAHPVIEELDAERIPTLPGSGGVIDSIDDALDGSAAILLRGSPEDVESASRYLSLTAPFLGRRGKDAPQLVTVKEDLRRFLARRTSAGQAAAALDIAGGMLDAMPQEASDPRLTVTVDRSEPGLARYLAQRFGDRASVEVSSRDVPNAPEIWSIEHKFDPEIERARAVLGDFPDSLAGRRVAVDMFISEPRPVREALAAQIRGELEDLGADARISVLPAYKQGFGWIEEMVLPQLVGQDVDTVTIHYARNEPPPSWPYQAMQTPTRWLLELFPIDEVLTSELGLELEAVQFVETPAREPIYTVTASSGGAVVFDESFHPALLERPYFDLYPAYERVRITAGWARMMVDDEVVVDRHAPTDLELVWDLYQQEILPKLHDYTLRLHDGEPQPSRAPHFGVLEIEATLSEPDRPLGIDQERIAPMEALHEELYFGTLHFFDLLGRVANGSPLPYPGRVIPIVRPRSDGNGGAVSVRLTGFEAPVPRVELTYTENGTERRVRRDLPPLSIDGLRIRRLVVERADAVQAIGIWLPVDTHDERREELLSAYPARQLDSSWIASERLIGALAALGELRAAGLYADELAYATTPEIKVAFGADFEPSPDDLSAVLEPGTARARPSPDPAALVTDGATHRVQWDTPMPPAEAHSILAVMAQEFDAASIYRLGSSYLGREIWGLDLMAPLPGSHWSQAKASAYKPTVVYSARQHANEVSSTSHVLRMAQLLLDDPEWQPALDRLNVVVHPITNPDGAQLAYDLHQITPDHMLHAGYLGSLGVDATAGGGDRDPIYPEARVREQLWRMWLPDIFLNPHGYPSHEWVQPFSEYAGWVRHRTTRSRDWWGMRGWFMPGFAFLDDPDYPRHKEHAFRIRDSITNAINGLPEIVALNERAYSRYRRYGHDPDPDTFRMNLSNDVLIYTSLRGTRAGGSGWMARNPKVTIWSGSTEAPDETAHGPWLELVASAGLAWDKAILEYLLDLEHPVDRTVSSSGNAVVLRDHRERPGLVPGEDDEESP